MPPNFEISPLPPVIVSNLLAMLQRLPEATQQREAYQRSRITLGSASKKFSNKSTFNTIPSSTLSPTSIKYLSSLLSPKPRAKQNFLQHVSLPWSQAQSVVPWTMWARPSGITSVAIPDSTKTGSLQEFYKKVQRLSKQGPKSETTKSNPFLYHQANQCQQVYRKRESYQSINYWCNLFCNAILRIPKGISK